MVQFHTLLSAKKFVFIPRSTVERTRAKNHSDVSIAAKNFHNCAITNTIVAYTRAPKNSQSRVRNAVNTSTIVDIWVRIWRFIETVKSTVATNAERDSINAWLIICTLEFIRGLNRINAPSAVKLFLEKCCSNNIWEYTRANDLINVKCVKNPSPTDRTWLSTRDSTRDWNLINATFVQRLSPKSIIWRPIWIITPEPSHIPAKNAVSNLPKAVTCERIWKNAPTTNLRRAKV